MSTVPGRRERILAYLRANPDVSSVAAAQHLGLHVNSFKRNRYALRRDGLLPGDSGSDTAPAAAQPGLPSAEGSAPRTPPAAPDLIAAAQPAADFIARLDLPARISAALSALGEYVITDSALRAQLQIPADKWRRAADRDEFHANRVRIHDRLYWAQPRVIEEINRKLQVI